MNNTSLTNLSYIIPEIILGFILILTWMPAIFITESINKGNKVSQTKLSSTIDKAIYNKNTLSGFIEGIITLEANSTTSSIISFTESNINNHLTSPVSVPFPFSNDFIYVKQVLEITQTKNKTNSSGNYIVDNSGHYVTTTTTTTSNTIKTRGNLVFINKDNYSKINIKDIDNIANLIDTPSEHMYTFTDNTNILHPVITKYSYTYYGIVNNQNVIDTTSINALEILNKIPANIYENGNIKNIKEFIMTKKPKEDTLTKWIYRIGIFFILAGGIQLLLNPFNIILNNTSIIVSTLPVLSSLGSFINFIGESLIFLFNYLGIFTALILTVLMTFIVYGIINYTLEVSILITLLIIFIIYKEFINK